MKKKIPDQSNFHTTPLSAGFSCPAHKDRFLLRTYLYLFLLGSMLGYLWEVFLYLILYHSLVNRGFFHGPWLPVYGCGAVLLELLLRSFSRTPAKRKKMHMLFLFLLSAVVCSILEYLLSVYLEWRYQTRYWDYRSFPLHLNGRVCLYSFLGFGLAGVLLYYFFFPRLYTFLKKMSAHTARTIFLFFFCFFLIDFIYSCFVPNTGSNITFPVIMYIKKQFRLFH